MADNEFGGDGGGDLIPFPDLRPNTKLGAQWAEEIARINKDRKTKIVAISPIGALAELKRKQTLPTMPWPATWDELGKRARLYAGECLGITGPTGGGKTSFAMQIARACAADGIPVLWNPKELDAPELDVRIAANMMGEHTAKLRDEWPIERFDHALASIDDVWRYVDNLRDTQEQIELYQTLIRAVKRIFRRPPLLVIDYMGKLARGARDPRLAIADAAEDIRKVILDEDAYCLMLNQPSRGNNDTLTGKKELEAASDAVAVASESSEIENACSVMIGLNVFKRDDCDVLDAHVLVTKARGTGREGREGFRFSKPGGVWSPLDYLPATPGQVEVEQKKQESIAKKAKLDKPTKEETRTNMNADASNSAEYERARRIAAALRKGGINGMTLAEISKVPGTGRAQVLERSLQMLSHKGEVEKLIGSKRWRLIPR